MNTIKNIFSYRKYWAKRFGISPFLPMSAAEMDQLGWDQCDIIIVTGDAYIDHPSFGMAMIGRLLENQGFRVGIIAQPDWRDKQGFMILGEPRLFFGVTAGNMDSMVNRYTADRKIRSEDAYTPDGKADQRPDRAVIVYSQRCKEAYNNVPIIIGGIEASLRRVAHFDYWSEKVRRSILVDAKSDLLVYGNAERAITEIAHRLAANEAITDIDNVRGTAIIKKILSEEVAADLNQQSSDHATKKTSTLLLPAFETVRNDETAYAYASRMVHLETNPGNAKTLIQPHGHHYVVLNPPPIPLTTSEMDQLYELPYARIPHPHYQNKRIPAYEMIRFSVTIMRGCFGGCTFCSITEHEGRIIQSRSESSVLNEIETIRDKIPGFTGQISDIGGPTANMYRMACKDPQIESSCRRLSCIYPGICKNLNTDHDALTTLYKKAREIKGVKNVFIASGVRYDLAILSKPYIKELTTHHVGGYLKIAPEHTEEGPLSKMMKPGIEAYDRFKELFEQYSKQAGKEQYLIPYFIAAHPGTTEKDMMTQALWLKKNNFRPDQVQTFLPTPMALATSMYHTGKNPLHKVSESSETVYVPKGQKKRRLQKAFLRYHDPKNWPLLREALTEMGRSDLIGVCKNQLIPEGQSRHKNQKSVKPIKPKRARKKR